MSPANMRLISCTLASPASSAGAGTPGKSGGVSGGFGQSGGQTGCGLSAGGRLAAQPARHAVQSRQHRVVASVKRRVGPVGVLATPLHALQPGRLLGHFLHLAREIDPEEELILSREVLAAGRSSCRINMQPVPLAALKAVGRLLVNIHGQSEHVSLLEPEKQLHLLDSFGGEAVAEQRRQVPPAFAANRRKKAAQTRPAPAACPRRGAPARARPGCPTARKPRPAALICPRQFHQKAH